MNPWAAQTRFILVRPRNPNNIGAVARAMANFGLRDLAVVDPHEPVWREARSAVGAGEILERAKAASLAEALGGAGVVLGTSDGRRKLKQPMIPLPGFADFLRRRGKGKICVLFGSEKTGLTNRELAHCQALVTIPTDRKAPSMNLGQAAALVAYELARPALPRKSVDPERELPTAEQREDLLVRALAAMERVGYARGTPDGVKTERLRRMLAGWNLTKKDAAFLQAVFRRVCAL